MKLAFDVCYNGNIAQSVCIGFEQWRDSVPKVIYKEFVMGIEKYAPGEFFKRELPCIEKILDKLKLKEIELIIVDGYVFLDDSGKPGLGAHLHDRLKKQIPVIGVAKTSFGEDMKNIREVCRGESTKPLFISSIGIGVDEAAEHVKNMFGSYRIPALLKRLDQLTKK